MDIEEANKVLEELSKDVRPEILNDKAKGLFDAIMKIADERDEVKSDLYEANNRINDLLEIVDNKDKIINKAIDIIENYQICDYEITDYRYRKCEYIADDETPPCKECIREYLESE